MIYSSLPAVRFYCGGTAATVRGQRVNLTGDRCFTAAHSPRKMGAVAELDPNEVNALGDSGAFTDVRADQRLTPEAALGRQLEWEKEFSAMCGGSFRFEAVVSYDRLIDEKLVDGVRMKRRWSVAEAETAITETVAAAHYLASRRRELWPRSLVLACQGVDAAQYERCVGDVLRIAEPDDVIGFGGWCILGRFRSWLPVFFETCWRTFPKIAQAGVSRVHIFGVLYEPALGTALWLADEFGLRLSVDSAAPMLACTRANARKAGVRAPGGADANIQWWRDHLANLRESRFYRRPGRLIEQS